MYYKGKAKQEKRNETILIFKWFYLTPNGWGDWVNFTPPPCGFYKTLFSREVVKPWIFVTLNIIIRHIFPEYYI